MADRIRNLKVGDAIAKDTEIGPVVDPGQLKQDTDYIEIGKTRAPSWWSGASW